MAPDDPPHDGPSIAPPSFGFGRKKKPAPPPVAPDPDPAPAPPVEQRAPASVVETPAAPVPPTTPTGRPRTIFDRDLPVEPPPPPSPSPAEPPAPEPVAEAPDTPVVVPEPEPEPVDEPTELVPGPVADPVDETPTVTFTPSPPVPPDGAAELNEAEEALSPASRRRGRVPRPAKPPRPAKAPKAPKTAKAPKTERPPREPRDLAVPAWLGGRVAAIVTGVAVGLFVVGATAAALRLCEVVRGTSSCGGAGFFLLVAILVLGVLVGTALLRLSNVPDAGSTSFLAVGLMSVLALLFLVGSIFAWWMVIAIPLMCAATFALSHWVSTTFIDAADG